MIAKKVEDPRRKDCLDFKSPNLWMHSVERMDTCNPRNVWQSFAIVICTLAVMFLILYAAGEYGKAYPEKNSIVNK